MYMYMYGPIQLAHSKIKYNIKQKRKELGPIPSLTPWKKKPKPRFLPLPYASASLSLSTVYKQDTGPKIIDK